MSLAGINNKTFNLNSSTNLNSVASSSNGIIQAIEKYHIDVLFAFVLFLVMLIALIFFIMKYHERVNPSECNQKTAGDFGVIPDKMGPVLNTCGGSECTFQVADLKSAITKCIMYDCKQFTFDGNTVKLISETTNYTDTKTTNLYIKNK